MTILRTTHLCQFFYLEDVEQVLKREKFELFPEIFPQVLLGEEHDRYTLTIHLHQRLQHGSLFLTLLHVIKDRPCLRPTRQDLLLGQLTQLN